MRSLIAGILFKLSPARVMAESWLLKILMGVLAHFTYVSLGLILVLSGTLLPIPEDIPLVISGYMCNTTFSPIKDLPQRIVDLNGDGVADPLPAPNLPDVRLMMVAGMLGVLLGDTIVFHIGRKGVESNNMVAKHLRKVLHSKRREKVERHFAKHGNLTIFVGRFMPGFRSIIFAFAGMSKMSYFRFLAIDGLAALVSVPTFIYLGYRFAEQLTALLAWIDRVKRVLVPAALVIGIGILIIYIRRKRRAAAA